MGSSASSIPCCVLSKKLQSRIWHRSPSLRVLHPRHYSILITYSIWICILILESIRTAFLTSALLEILFLRQLQGEYLVYPQFLQIATFLCPVWSLNLKYSILLPQVLLNQFVFLLLQLRSIYVFLSNINFLNDHLVWEQIPAYVLLRDNWVVDLHLFLYYFF